MQRSWWRHKSSNSSWKQRLDCALGEINVVLVALVIGLAVLDIGCFFALTATEIRRAHSSSHEVQPSLSQAWPVWLPFPPPTSVTAQKMDPL